jgi:hypothetical protein
MLLYLSACFTGLSRVVDGCLKARVRPEHNSCRMLRVSAQMERVQRDTMVEKGSNIYGVFDCFYVIRSICGYARFIYEGSIL